MLLLIGFMPGMPNFLFLIAALIAASAAYFVHLSEQKTEAQPVETEEEVEEKAPDKIELSDVTDNAPISVQIGYGLVEMVDEDAGGRWSTASPASASKCPKPLVCCTCRCVFVTTFP